MAIREDGDEVVLDNAFFAASIGRVYVLHLGGQLALLAADELGGKEELGEHGDALVGVVQDVLGLDLQLV